MFYGSPLSGQPAPSSKPPADQALSKVRQAVKDECHNDATLFMMENKKLYLAIVEGYELRGQLAKSGQAPSPEAMLMQELRHQLLAFALMQCLPDTVCKACAAAAQSRAEAGERSQKTRSGLLVSELEARLQDTEDTQAQVSRWLMMQPLFRVLNAQPELFSELARFFGEVALKMPDLVKSTNQSLVTLMKSAPRE